MNILVTGATGFIGSFIVEEAIKRGMNVWAAVRPTSSRKYISDPRINTIELDLGDKQRLKEQLGGHTFDYVVHAAGATKCLHKADFYRVNTDGTRHLADALVELRMPLRRFVFLSSLSVMGPVREQRPYADISVNDEPRPDTAYGMSKLKAERYLDSLDGFPVVTLRPTGVYGPREHDYFMMAQSIKKHTDFAAGLKPQDLTFIYVADVVQAVFPGPGARAQRRKVLPERRLCLRLAHVQRPHHRPAGPPVGGQAQGAAVAPEGYNLLRRVCRQAYRAADGTEQRQIPHHEAAQLEVRHCPGQGRTGLRTAIPAGARGRGDHQVVQGQRVDLRY